MNHIKFKQLLVCNILFILLGYQENTIAQDWVNIHTTFNPSGNYLTSIGYFSNKNHGWWTDPYPGNIWKTTDEGITWNKQFDSIEAWYSDVKFVDTLNGWFVGRSPTDSNDVYFLLSTKDGGKSWSKYSTPPIGCLILFDSLNGFAGGEDSIYSTTDGGVTWQAETIEPGIRFGIMDIYFVDKLNGWAVGISSNYWDAGIILNTTNGGKYWKVNLHPSGIVGLATYFTDSLHGYVVGSNPPVFNGVIKVTSDGGVSWITHYLPCTWLKDIVFIDDNTGWAVGDYGFIWHTTDRGLNWNRIESGTTSHLYRIFFFDNGKLGYILGADSTLLKYDKTVDINADLSPKELSFKLYQNYPNPFNSQTEIDFTILNREMVVIEVYDILGRRVKTLMSKVLEPGKHRISFDASGLTSGVYYYSMITKSQRTTKKMLLLR